MMDNLQGYKIQSADICKVNAVLHLARKRVMEAQKEEFHRLLSEEITEIVDDAALKVTAKLQEDILKEAEMRLREKIAYTSRRGYNNAYNFEATVSIIPSSNANETYLMLYCVNDLVREAFATTEGIEDYSLDSDASQPEQEKRTKVWNQLKDENGEDNPLIIKAFLSGPIAVDAKLLKFSTAAARASVRARQHLMNLRLQMFSFGQEIRPEQLMPKIDLMLDTITLDDSDDMDTIADAIEPQLPEISVDENGKIVTAFSTEEPEDVPLF